MNTRTENVRSPASRLFLACCAVLGLCSSAHAVCTATATVACLADQPIQSASTVKPNVMFVLDNSGSMLWNFMPDAVYNNGGKRCFRNYQYNKVYYDPTFNYTAAVPKNAMNASMGNQSYTSAAKNPFASSTTYVNLSTSYCGDVDYYGQNCTAAHSPLQDKDYQNGYYYKFTGSGNPTTCLSDGNYTKVSVSASSCTVGGDVTACPTGADERQNFANWFSYFRTRRLMMKSGMATAFAPLDDKYRVGFYTINSPSDSTYTNGAALNITDFSGGGSSTPKGNWYSALFKVEGSSGTPLQSALDNIGKYYSGTPPSGLSGDPVQYSCQKNFTILSTDGYWNGTAPSRGDWDKNIPSSMPIKDGKTAYDPADTGLTAGTRFPRPYYEGSSASSNSLADIAMYYWVRDLRLSGSVSANNVKTTSSDPAYWQHMNTFTIGLGVNGTLAYPDDLAALTSGSKNWPVPAAESATAIDDLWHAAVNGRGQYYKANNPSTLATGLTSALLAITGESSYGVGPSSSTSDFKSPDENDYTTYVNSYRVINWSGDVKKYAVDRTTGLKTGAALWSAAKQLDLKANPNFALPASLTAYLTRNIVTRKETGDIVEFAYDNLSSGQKNDLCYKVPPGTSCAVSPDDKSLVNYLRGDPTYEGVYGENTYGRGVSRFRDRRDTTESTYYKRDLMGSIVNAVPAYVAAERFIYQESSDPGYDAFKAGKKTRSPTLYVPANDGMVHALDAATGNELWGYIPSFVMVNDDDENGKERGLRALSYQDSGDPPYNHHFYVDATPEVGSVDFARTGGPITATSPSGSWRTILVGGLGKGGRGIYALDVTDPATSGLADAMTKPLWEFPGAHASHGNVKSQNQMGYSFGKPIIAKTDDYGWVVIVASGYLNGENYPNGHGHGKSHSNVEDYGYVFVLNAKTGELLDTLKTTEKTQGLTHITALSKSNNRAIKEIYGGDLKGNVWRFDLLTPRVVTKIFESSGATPIASEVTVAVDGNDGTRWVFFGTGQYLDVPDRATTGTQYLAAVRDGTQTAPARTSAVALSALTTVSSLASGVTSAPQGWKFALGSLPNSTGERVAAKPMADLRTVIFTSLIPTTDPCSPGIAGYAYGLEYSTGASRLKNVTNNAYYSSTGISGVAIQTTGKTTTSSGTPQAVIYTPEGQAISIGLDTSKIYSGTRHVGWRELLNEY